jgi:peptide/nickel transport system ATP-binding protein
VLRAPRHPYTQGLLGGLPDAVLPGQRLAAIPGQVPDMRHPPSGCPFFDRCAFADEACRQRPALLPLDTDAVAPEPAVAGEGAAEGRLLACWHPLAQPADMPGERT